MHYIQAKRVLSSLQIMKGEEGEEVLEPMSPSAQYLESSALSLTILGVLEMEAHIDDANNMSMNMIIKDLFLPTNPRFSSIMVTTKKGARKWKRVEVNLEDHVHVPIFPSDMSVDYYDECFNEYLSKIAMEQFPQERPLWEIHILKYPTKNAAGNIIFKLHHSLGDGYSLMGALLSCLQRADDPSVPLTFPSRQSNIRCRNFLRRIPRFFTGIVDTVYDFGWSLLKSTSMEDDKSPIRSGVEGVKLRSIATTTTMFSIDQLKEIKSKLNVTINDVITGIISLGTRLYMQEIDEESCKSKTTAIVLLNTRAIGGYKSIDEMIKPNSNMPWGNRFAFLHVPLPKLTQSELLKPLDFVKKAHRVLKRQKNSAGVYLTGQLLSIIGTIKGYEAAGRHIHATLKNTSMSISNLIGPIEQMALANQPCKGLYFTVTGQPQSLFVTMISYVGKLRIAVTTEKGFADQNKMKSCIEYAFDAIYKAALEA